MPIILRYLHTMSHNEPEHTYEKQLTRAMCSSLLQRSVMIILSRDADPDEISENCRRAASGAIISAAAKLSAIYLRHQNGDCRMPWRLPTLGITVRICQDVKSSALLFMHSFYQAQISIAVIDILRHHFKMTEKLELVEHICRYGQHSFADYSDIAIPWTECCRCILGSDAVYDT